MFSQHTLFNANMSYVLTLILLLGFPTIFGLPAKEEISHESAQVLILGGGVAGVVAAKYLHDRGVTNFIILEGRDQLGGRLKDRKFAGLTIEEGANWVHGTEGNPTYELMKKHKMAGKISNYSDFTVRNMQGSDVTEAFRAKIIKFDDIWDKVINMSKEKIENGEKDISIRAALRYFGWKPTTPLDNLVEYFRNDFEVTVPPDVHSTKHFGGETHIDFKSEDFFVTDQRGHAYVIKAMAAEFLKPGDKRLHLEETVLSVTTKANKVVVVAKRGKTLTQYKADYALTTFSLGVLQSGTIQFVPQFPKSRLEAMYENRYGNYMKIFLKFPNETIRFWDSTEFILYADNRRGYYSVWQNLEAPGLFPPGTNLMLVTLTELEAPRVERMADKEIQAELMMVLRRMYGGLVPEPEAIFVPRWNAEPLFSGAYSYWPVGFDNEQFNNLTAPLGPVYFAGEALHGRYTKTITGAYYSGIDNARKILEDMVN